MQVLANGGIPALLSLASASNVGTIWPALFVDALAGASANTWATELGTRFGGVPRSIRTGCPIDSARSGAVTGIGMAATFVGALATALLGSVLVDPPSGMMLIVAAGIVTSLADSIAGATIQACYRCPTCATITEQPLHHCGAQALLTHGSARVTNDVVNLGSIVAGVLFAALFTI